MNVTCPHCRGALEAPTEITGTIQECPQCGKDFEVRLGATPPLSTRQTAVDAQSSAVVSQLKRQIYMLSEIRLALAFLVILPVWVMLEWFCLWRFTMDSAFRW